MVSLVLKNGGNCTTDYVRHSDTIQYNTIQYNTIQYNTISPTLMVDYFHYDYLVSLVSVDMYVFIQFSIPIDVCRALKWVIYIWQCCNNLLVNRLRKFNRCIYVWLDSVMLPFRKTIGYFFHESLSFCFSISRGKMQ